MRRLLLAITLVSAACAGSTSTAPSGSSATQSTAAPAASGGPGETPRVDPPRAASPQYRLSGPGDARDCVTAGRDAMRWTLEMSDAGPSSLQLVAVVNHDDAPGCARAEGDDRARLGVEGAATFAPHASGQAHFTFDPTTFTCGRAELSVALLDGNGTQAPLLTMVVDFGRACAAPAPPSPPPSPSPSPVPPAPPAVTPLTCGPPTQTIFGPAPTANVSATGGNGSYTWSAPGATVTSGTGSRFTTTYPVTGPGSFGDRTITVTSGSQTATCRVTIAAML